MGRTKPHPRWKAPWNIESHFRGIARGIRTMNVPVSPRDLPIPEDSPAKGHGAALVSPEGRQRAASGLPANSLWFGRIYLSGNPLRREPLTLAHVKPLV